MKNRYLPGYPVLSALLLALATGAWAQQTPAPASPDATKKSEDLEVINLSPFEVSTSNDNGYTSATTLAGNRLNTELRDIGNAVSVVNSAFLKDINATDNKTLLQYTTNTEVG